MCRTAPCRCMCRTTAHATPDTYTRSRIATRLSGHWDTSISACCGHADYSRAGRVTMNAVAPKVAASQMSCHISATSVMVTAESQARNACRPAVCWAPPRRSRCRLVASRDRSQVSAPHTQRPLEHHRNLDPQRKGVDWGNAASKREARSSQRPHFALLQSAALLERTCSRHMSRGERAQCHVSELSGAGRI